MNRMCWGGLAQPWIVYLRALNSALIVLSLAEISPVLAGLGFFFRTRNLYFKIRNPLIVKILTAD